MFEKIIEKLNYKLLVLGAIGSVLVLGIIILMQHQPAQNDSFPVVAADVEREHSTHQIEETVSESDTIWIDVKGAVQKPGVYELPKVSRVQDAVEAAGGLTDDADSKSINLAQKLADEAIVYVAKKGEEVSVIPSYSSQPQTDSSENKTEKINLNTATVAELTTISGIGEKRANDIIAYRESNGGFKTVDELNQVSGIGDKTLETLRPYVAID